MRHKSDSLYHWGILGQKWGIRRYQNPDGSLTAAGKERYGSREGFERYQKNKAKNKRDSRSMTEGELKSEVNRLRTERDYKNLMSEMHPTTSQKFKQISKPVWNETKSLGKFVYSELKGQLRFVQKSFIDLCRDQYKNSMKK